MTSMLENATHPGVVQITALRKELEKMALPETLGDLVRKAAEANGDKVLGHWIDEGVSLSYREFDERVDRLASSLVRQGVRKGTHVAVMLPNVPAFPISWVALGRIGAVMIPVNVAYRSDELHFVLSDSDSQFVIMDESLLPVFEAIEAPLPLIDRSRIILHGGTREGHPSWEALLEAGSLPFEPPSQVGRSDLLNIQYTSGTTGFPKGCMLSQDYWVLIGTYAAYFRNRDGGVKNTLIWAPFFYMDPQWQFLMTLQLGATAHVARRMSLSRFYDWLENYQINYCIFPEPALKARRPSEQDRKLALTYVSIYGWRPDTRKEVMERFGVVAREGYGMTEIGGASIVPVAAEDKALIPTCGLAGPFRELKIMDEEENEVTEPGQTGELWVTGRSILWGYYKRPEANAESFRGRWFRTGDIFKRDEDGFYYIVGRIKDMIRRSGENIAAREVEAVLTNLDAVAEAAVVPVPDELRREEVKAYLLLREGATPEDCPPEEVIRHCTQHLADFKVPRYVAYMTEDFPRTPSRKIQKKILTGGVEDLRVGAYDREEGRWR